MKVNLKEQKLFEMHEPKPKPVETYFDSESSHWNDIYDGQDVYSLIHQDRRVTALRFIDELCLPLEARILEIGCGAGFLTIDLARRGYRVTAVDSSPAMVELTRKNALRFDVASQISLDQADIYQLKFEDHSFDLIIALGVLPWLPDLPLAVREISRLLQPGGSVVFNIDNRYRLNHLLNPAHNPLFSKIKADVKVWAEKIGAKKPSSMPPVNMYSVTEFERMLEEFGLKVLQNRMLGFGPFQFFKWNLLSDKAGVQLYRYLQNLADRGSPLLRRSGSQYLVLAINKL